MLPYDCMGNVINKYVTILDNGCFLNMENMLNFQLNFYTFFTNINLYCYCCFYLGNEESQYEQFLSSSLVSFSMFKYILVKCSLLNGSEFMS